MAVEGEARVWGEGDLSDAARSAAAARDSIEFDGEVKDCDNPTSSGGRFCRLGLDENKVAVELAGVRMEMAVAEVGVTVIEVSMSVVGVGPPEVVVVVQASCALDKADVVEAL